MNRLISPVFAGLMCLPFAHAGDLNLTAAQQQALGVVVQPLQPAGRAPGGAYPARLTPAPGGERVVSALQEGLVSRVLVVEGQAVKAGTPLLELQVPALLDMQLALLKADGRNRLAQTTLQRNRQMLAEGLIAGKRVMEAEIEAAAAAAELRTAALSLKLAGMSDAQLTRLSARQQAEPVLTLTAPMAGQVSGLKVTPGQRVPAAEELLRVVSGRELWVDAEAPLDAVARFRLGGKAAVGGGAAEATVVSVAAQSGNAQSVRIRARLLTPLPGGLPGMATTLGETGGGNAGWQVPRAAVTRISGKSAVFVQRPGGFAPVTVTATGDDRTAVISGALRGDEHVAVSGVSALRNAWQAGQGGQTKTTE